MAGTLSEPAVLAAAKDALYPEIERAADRFVVTETQFTADKWGDWPIPPEVRERLAPFNAVRLASDEPDLLGVGTPAVEVFFADGARRAVLTRDGRLVDGALADPAVYKSGVHFQFKTQLYHVGLLTTDGTDDARAALSDEWQLERPVGIARRLHAQPLPPTSRLT